MKIGIMSDSHGDRRAIDRAVERAGKVDLWLHAGDCAPDAAYLALVSAVRVENVAGNTDWPDGKTPDEIVVEAAGHRIFLTHGHIYGVRSTLEMLVAAAKEAQADIAVYGHTHVAQEVAGAAWRARAMRRGLPSCSPTLRRGSRRRSNSSAWEELDGGRFVGKRTKGISGGEFRSLFRRFSACKKSERDSSFSLQKLKKHKGFGVECAMKI